MLIKDFIKSRSAEFISLCKNHEVKSLYIFGSAITPSFNEEISDIDLLIELETEDPIKRGEFLLDLWEKFENFFQRKVDLLTNTSIRNPFLKESIDSNKLLIYDGKEQKIFS